jgi:hypothetical protein
MHGKVTVLNSAQLQITCMTADILGNNSRRQHDAPCHGLRSRQHAQQPWQYLSAVDPPKRNNWQVMPMQPGGQLMALLFTQKQKSLGCAVGLRMVAPAACIDKMRPTTKSKQQHTSARNRRTMQQNRTGAPACIDKMGMLRVMAPARTTAAHCAVLAPEN